MKNRNVYLDNAATTPLDKEVNKHIFNIQNKIYGNPSSFHKEGRAAFDILDIARKSAANSINAKSEEIIFTGSGTESDNLAIFGIAHAHQHKGKHIIVSAIEHKAVLSAAKELEKEGFDITYIQPNENGFVDIDKCIQAIRKDTILISLMYANNEIGTIQNIKALTTKVQTLRKDKETPFVHTDACQAVGMLPVNVQVLGIDLMTINSSKIYGPKGVGLLYIKNGIDTTPHIVGGDQENGKRAGTENVALISGFAMALEKSVKREKETAPKLEKLRDYFIENLKKELPDLQISGLKEKRLPNNVHVIIPHVEGEALVLMLAEKGIACSTGSACSSTDLTPSHVLQAIKISDDYIHGSVRFSLGLSTTIKDLDYTILNLKNCVDKLRQITPSKLPYQNI